MRERETVTGDLRTVVRVLAREIARLDPGQAAALRRGPLAGAGAASFWKLMASYVPEPEHTDPAQWADLMQAIAILTPKGEVQQEKHGANHADQSPVSLGTALYAAGVSELRLARLLTAPRVLRRELLVRTCRYLSAKEQRSFDLWTLARFMRSHHEDFDHRLARDYYYAQAKDRRRADTKENPIND